MLVIECTHCQARYQYDESRFEGKPSKKIRCAKCQQIFEIQLPDPGGSPARGGSGESDETVTRRRRRTIEEPLPPEMMAPEENAQPVDTGAKLPAGKRLSLAIIEGPDPGKVFRIENPRVVIGRSSADLVLNDSETSRHHAVVEIHDHLYILEDLGSTNGTFFEGNRLTGPVELQNHSEFTLGVTTIMMIVTDSD